MTATRPARTRTRSLGAATVAAVLAAVVLTFGPGAQPASACSCMAQSDAEHFAQADVVFRGTLIGYQPPPPSPVMFSGAPATWTFSVSEVYKGDAAPTQPVISAVDGATCGLEIPHQGEYVVFAGRAPEGHLHASLCGGTRSTAAGPLTVVAPAPAATPAPPVPTLPPTVPPTTAAVPEPEPPTTVAPVLEQASVAGARPVRAEAGSAGNLGLVVATIGAALLAAGMATAVVLRRRN